VRQHFLLERSILARLQHPGIARLLDGGITSEGVPYFALEHIEGRSLMRYCEEESLGTEERIRLLVKVCDAVHYAHRNLVVHRDLKPSNILVLADGEPKLLDFGIAKLLEAQGGDAPATRVMTPEYAAPEQVRGEVVTTATDVYALGLLLYELLTGERPFARRASTPATLVRAILEEDPIPPSRVPTPRSRSLRGDLDAIAMKALRKEPDRRYPSAEALAEDLRRYLGGLPVVARGDARGYRLRKFLRRHLWGVSAAAAVLIVLVGGITATAWQAREARDQARRARAIQSFLVSLFRSSDPAQAKAHNVTAKEILDRGATRVETELKDQPEIQVELWRVLAELYARFSDHGRSAELLRRALALQTARAPNDELEIARLQLQLASTLWDQGKTNESDRLVREALPVLERRLGEKSPEVADALDVVAAVCSARGDGECSERYHRRSLEIRRKLFGEDSLEYATEANNLAVLLLYRGDLAESERLNRVAADVRRRRLGLEDPATLLSLHNLAMLLFQTGRMNEHEQIVREILPVEERVLGPEHDWTRLGRQMLARLHAISGRYAEAKRLVQAAIAAGRTRYGEPSEAVGMALVHLSSVEGWRGDLDAAERVGQSAVAMLDRVGVAAGAAFARSELAETLLERGRFSEAEALLREATRMLRETLGPRGRFLADAVDRLGMVVFRRGRREEARAFHEEALGIHLATHNPAGAARARAHLVATLPAGAPQREALLRQAFADLRRTFPIEHPWAMEATLALGAFLTERGRAQEAQPLLAEALLVRRKLYGPRSPRTAEAQLRLALCLRALGRAGEARRLLALAKPVLEAAGAFYEPFLREAKR
jgi:serine/threonine-protein kinase